MSRVTFRRRESPHFRASETNPVAVVLKKFVIVYNSYGSTFKLADISHDGFNFIRFESLFKARHSSFPFSDNSSVPCLVRFPFIARQINGSGLLSFGGFRPSVGTVTSGARHCVKARSIAGRRRQRIHCRTSQTVFGIHRQHNHSKYDCNRDEKNFCSCYLLRFHFLSNPIYKVCRYSYSYRRRLKKTA